MGAGASALQQALPAVDERDGNFMHTEGGSILDRISIQDNFDYSNAETVTIAARIFAELDVHQTGILHCEDLVHLANEFFHTQPTVQPESWVRTQIIKHDADGDGALNMDEFCWAVDSLRRC